MNKLIKLARYVSILYFACVFSIRNIFRSKSKINIGFIVEEFFHEKFRGFGGYGMTIKYIAEHFNNLATAKIKSDVILTHRVEIDAPESGSAHAAEVVMMPKSMHDSGKDFWKYCRMINRQRHDVFVGVDHFLSYEYPLMAFPNIPWVVWLKDPRDLLKFKKYLTVDLQFKVWGIKNPDDIVQFPKRTSESFHRVLKRSRMFKRKVIFASEAKSFTDIGKRLYGLSDLNPAFLSKPIPLPRMESPSYSEKPSFLFLARLDPVKRPWIFCELAKRFKEAEFLIVGQSNVPDIMNDILAKYKDVPNLKFLGRVFGADKDTLFRKIWAVVNTSVHEGLPVSMVEGFSYGKTIVASENPDGLTEKFGFWTGEMTGNGHDTKTLDLYSEPIERIIKGRFDREEMFKSTRQYIQDVHSFEKFEEAMCQIVLTDRYKNNFSVAEKTGL